MVDKIIRTDAEWRALFSPEQYKVARKKGTERAFSHPGFGPGRGVYCCAGCGAGLFPSDAKFDSGTGWPSFFEPVAEDAIEEHDDRSFFMRRTEVVCARCDTHLGHVFPDGPPPTGLRYCINGIVLTFEREDAGEPTGKS